VEELDREEFCFGPPISLEIECTTARNTLSPIAIVASQCMRSLSSLSDVFTFENSCHYMTESDIKHGK
jgi:hypothetical protein